MALFDKLKDGLLGLKGKAGSVKPTPDKTNAKASILDNDGKTPLQYSKVLGSTNSSKSTFSSNSGFTLDKRLPFSQLGLGGKKGDTFESVDQQSTSDIQALAKNNQIQGSQDLITGRKYGKGRFTTFVPASKLDNNGIPVGKIYKDKGPKEGRY